MVTREASEALRREAFDKTIERLRELRDSPDRPDLHSPVLSDVVTKNFTPKVHLRWQRRARGERRVARALGWLYDLVGWF